MASERDFMLPPPRNRGCVELRLLMIPHTRKLCYM